MNKFNPTGAKNSAPSRPDWILGGSRWTARSSVDFPGATAAVANLCVALTAYVGAVVVLTVHPGPMGTPELQLSFVAAAGRQELRLPFGPAGAQRDSAMPATTGEELVRVCASWDEAWWIACGLINSLGPNQVKFSCPGAAD